MVSELYKESTEKGSVSLNFDALNEDEKKHMQNILSSLSIRREDLDEDETHFFDEFEKMLSQNPNFNQMSPESFIDSLGLDKEDRESLELELKDMVSKAEEELKKVNLSHLFPDAEHSVSDFSRGLQRCMQAHPESVPEITEWLNSVQTKLGNDVHKLEKLSDEEFAAIALPPEHLRTLLKEYMPSSNRISDINFDASCDPRDAFVFKRLCVC